MMNVETALLSAVQKLMANPKFDASNLTAFYSLSARYDGCWFVILQDASVNSIRKKIPKIEEMLPGATLSLSMVLEQYDSRYDEKGWEEHLMPLVEGGPVCPDAEPNEPGEQEEMSEADMEECYRAYDEMVLNSEAQKTAELMVYNRSAACRRRARSDDDD